MAKRGQLTTAIQQKAIEFWGREIDQAELRLYPYVYDSAINSRKLDPQKISPDERVILRIWKDAGHFEGGASGINMTKELFDFINEILWMSYFAYDSEEFNEL